MCLTARSAYPACKSAGRKRAFERRGVIDGPELAYLPVPDARGTYRPSYSIASTDARSRPTYRSPRNMQGTVESDGCVGEPL